MGFFRGVGKAVKPLVDVPKWMDSKRLAEEAGFINGLIKRIFKPQQATRQEEFDEALKRLNLTEQDVQQRYVEFRRLFIIFFTIAVLIFIYTIYLIFHSPLHAVLLSIGVFGIPLALAFRYHFWMFQIKRRKLGCSVREWFYHGLLGRTS